MSLILVTRVYSKQTKINFGSNRNKPKQDLFGVCFGLFRETISKKCRFVSVFRGREADLQETKLILEKFGK